MKIIKLSLWILAILLLALSNSLWASSEISFDLKADNNNPQFNDTVRFEFENVSGGTEPYSYKWTTNTGASGDGRAFSYSFRIPGIHTLRVTVTDRRNRSASRTFTYNIEGSAEEGKLIGRVIEAGIDLSNENPLTGDTVYFYTSYVKGGISPYTYQWFVEDEAVGGEAKSTYIWNTPGRYKVALRVTDAERNSTSVHKYVNVRTEGYGVLQFIDWISAYSPRVGETVNMEIRNLSGGTSPYTYRWELDGRYISSSRNLSHRFTKPGEHNLTVIVTDGRGLTERRYRTIRVQEEDFRVSFSWTPENPKLGDRITLRAEVRGGVSPYRYSWKMNNSEFGSGSSAVYTFNRPGAHNLTAMVRDDYGNEKATSHRFDIKPQAQPINFTISSSDNNPKIGQSVVFELNNLRGGNAPYHITWSMNGSSIGSGDRVSYVFRNAGSNRLMVNVRDSSGESKSAERLFNITTQPFACTFNWPSRQVKRGETVVFSARVTSPGQPPYNIVWKIDGNTIGTGIQTSYVFNRTGTFNIQAEASDSAGGRVTGSHSIRVEDTSITPSDLNLSIRINNNNPRRGDTVNLNAQITGGKQPYNVRWTVNGASIGSGTGVSYRFEKAGSHTIQAEVIDSQGSRKSQSITVNVRGFQINP